MNRYRSYRVKSMVARGGSIPWAVIVILAAAIAGCAFDPPPQGTPGGFGNGDPASIPAFQQSVSSGRAVSRLSLPKVGGGNAELIAALLDPAVISTGTRVPDADAAKMRRAVLEALSHPSANPARLFFVGRAYALEQRPNLVVLLICDSCGTGALAMRTAGHDGDTVLSPQFDLSVLGSLFTP
jgi:hypothetical protein